MRAIAALSVVAGHAMYEATSLNGARSFGRVLEGEFWMAGVDLFFILSGFIMMWTFGQRFGQAGAAQEFLVRRIIRIVPPYWFFTALIILAILVFADHVKTTSFTPAHAILSFLFIPHLAPQGGVHPILLHGWTLVYEMFFYVAFALALLLPRKEGLIALAGLFFSLNALAIYTGILPMGLSSFLADPIMFEFLLGIAFFFLQRDGKLSTDRLVLILAACCAAGVVAYATGSWSQNRFFYFGLPAFACFAIGYYLLTGVQGRMWMLLILIGEASYALYLSHPFTLEVVEWAFLRSPLEGPGPIALYLVTSITLATLVSIVFWSTFERPLNYRLTRWLLGPRNRQVTAV